MEAVTELEAEKHGIPWALVSSRAMAATGNAAPARGKFEDDEPQAEEAGAMVAGAQSANKTPSGQIIYSRISEIEAKPILWLWPGRIARGKVTMIAGNPGLGKSQVTISMAAIVSLGGLWPVDRKSCARGNVVILSAEDDAADTIKPRLEAAGADLERVHIVQAVRAGFSSAGDELRRPFNLREDVQRLRAVLAEIGDVALTIIDPISAYLGGTDSHNNADVRALLSPLSEMSADAATALVAVSHLNKGGAGASDALMRVTGSLAFVAAARAAFIVVKDPEDEKRRLLLPAKNNIAADIGGLAFGIESAGTGQGIETSRIVWESAPVTGVSADELLRQPTNPEEHSALEDAKDWLRGMLADGPVQSKQIMAEGREAGHPERTLFRARKALGVEAVRETVRGPWMLSLSPKAAKNAQGCQVSRAGSVGSLGSVQGDQEPAGDGGNVEEIP